MSTQGISFRAEHSVPATPPCAGCRLAARCTKVGLTCRAFDHYETTNRVVPLYRGKELRELDAVEEV